MINTSYQHTLSGNRDNDSTPLLPTAPDSSSSDDLQPTNTTSPTYVGYTNLPIVKKLVYEINRLQVEIRHSKNHETSQQTKFKELTKNLTMKHNMLMNYSNNLGGYLRSLRQDNRIRFDSDLNLFALQYILNNPIDPLLEDFLAKLIQDFSK